MLGLDKRNRKTVLLSEVWNPKNLVRKTAKMSHLNATEASALASAKASLRSRFSYQAQKATPPSTSSKSSNLSLRDVVSSETVSAQERTGNPVPRSTPLSGAERDTIVCALGCTFGSEQCSKDTSWDPIIIDNVEYQSSAAVMFAEERNLCQDSFSTRMVDFACPEVLELDISFTDDCEASQCVPSASLSRELSSAHVSVQASPSGSFAIDMSKGALHEASPAFALPLRLDKNWGVTLVDYLRRHHHNDIKRCIFESQRAKDAMKGKYNNYQCLLNLDPLMLLDFDASLSLVRWDKSVTSAIFEACLALLNQTLQGGVILTSRPLQAEDLHLILRAAYLPAINELTVIDWKRDMFVAHERTTKVPRMCRLIGSIMQLSLPTYEVIKRRYQCEWLSCAHPNQLTVTKVVEMGDTHFEGVKRTQQGHVVQRLKESKISDLALACTTCHETMIESVADRGFSRIQTMQVTSLHSGNNCSSNVVTAVLRDDLVNVAEIGDCIELVGTHARATLNPEGTFQSSVKGIAYSVVFTVNNARKIDWSPTDGYSCKLESKLRDTKIPASIEALLSANLSSFAFTQRLVDSFCARYCPASMWRKLRLSLLLSLVSTEPSSTFSRTSNVRHAINVLVASDDITPMQLRLLQYACRFRRCTEWRAGSEPLTGVSGKENAIHSSPLTRAKDGILLLGLDGTGKADITSLMEVVEKPILETKFNVTEDPYVHHSNFVLWATSTMALKITGKVNTEQIRTSIATPLLPHFDICVNLKSSSLQDHEQCLAEFVLQQSINSPAPAPNISHDDFANFIHAVSKIRVTIPSHCTEYIQSYFVCTRKSLSSLASAGAFSSLVTIESLVRITIAHARLCLRDEAQLDDVLVAVMLVEESLVFASGVSVLGFISLPEDQENIWKLCSNDFVKSEWDEVDGGKTSTEDQAMLRLYVELEKAIST